MNLMQALKEAETFHCQVPGAIYTDARRETYSYVWYAEEEHCPWCYIPDVENWKATSPELRQIACYKRQIDVCKVAFNGLDHGWEPVVNFVIV